MQNYDALVTAWNNLTETTIAEKLVAINALSSGQTDINGNELTWAQFNGWNGPINQNDLVPAGIITPAQRIDFELSQGWITADKATQLHAELGA